EQPICDWTYFVKTGGPPSCPSDPLVACSSSTLRGDLRTSAPGAYLPAVSASGTCAYRRAARAARRPDLMDKPSLQTSQAIAGSIIGVDSSCPRLVRLPSRLSVNADMQVLLVA